MKTLTAIAMLIAFNSMSAATSLSANDGFDPKPNGIVRAIAVQPDGKILAGGDFTRIDGKLRNRIARLNDDGTIDGSFEIGAGANGRVSDIILQRDGRILVAGWFTEINGVDRDRIARLNADGSVDESFDPGAGANANINVIALQPDGKILIAGGFTAFHGATHNRIARLYDNGSLDSSFNPAADREIDALAVQPNGKILIGGRFTLIDTHPAAGMARLNANGSFDATCQSNVGVGGSVSTLVLQPNQKIVAGGTFSAINSVSCNGIARLNTTGAVSGAFGDGAAGAVNAVVVKPNGKVLAGGRFVGLNGTLFGLEQFNADGSLDAEFDASDSVGRQVRSMALEADGEVLLSGVDSPTSGTVVPFFTRIGGGGEMDGTFNPGLRVNSDVNTISVAADGTALLSGTFTYLSGSARNGLARLRADGTLDALFDPGAGVDGVINTAIAQPDGRVLIGGKFTSFNGSLAADFARLNSDGTRDGGFLADLDPAGSVRQVIVLPSGKMLVAGGFSTASGHVYRGLARLNEDGSADTLFQSTLTTGSLVQSMAVAPDSKIILSNEITTSPTLKIYRLMRLNVDGSIDTTFAPQSSVPTNVTAMLMQRGKVLMAGSFGVMRMSTSGKVDATFKQNMFDKPVTSIALQGDGKVIVGGPFTTVNGVQRNSVARLNADGTLDDSFNPGEGMNGAVNAVGVLRNGKILVGGTFDNVDENQTGHFARLNSDGTLDTKSTYAATGSDKSISALALQADGRVVIGGAFTNVNGTTQTRIARLNAEDGGLDPTFDVGLGADNSVKDLIVQADGKVLAAGKFTSMNGAAMGHVARLNTDGSLDPGFNPGAGADDFVFAMAMQPDGKILLGGMFRTIDGRHCHRIARLNVDGSVDPTFRVEDGPNADVNSIALQADGKIVIAGKFTAFGGERRRRVARLNSDGALDTSFNPRGANREVIAAAVQPDGKIVLAGEFRLMNGMSRRRIARLEADGTLDETFQPGSGADDDVKAIALQADGKIRIGGEFSRINGTARRHFARLNEDGSLDETFDPGSGTNRQVLGLAIQANGKSLMGGNFNTAGGEMRKGLARLSNPDSASQRLSIGSDRRSVTWELGGSFPMPNQVLFETSSDGMWWSALGWGWPVPGTGFQISGLATPIKAGHFVRATGWASGGEYNGSASIHRAEVQYVAAPKTITPPDTQYNSAGNWLFYQ